MPYRILALDGGGIRGLLTVALLRRICQQPGMAGWLDSVDLVAGTSSGGLIALALAHGLGQGTTLATLERIEQVFLTGRRTFGPPRSVLLGGRWLFPRFGTRARAESFRSALGDATLGDLQKRVLVATFDLDDDGRHDPRPRRWQPKLFHNFYGDEDRERLAWKVAMYTTAGPTYFPTADGFIDGGVYSNNPSMCALAQARDTRYRPNPPLRDIVLFSVGAGLNPRFIKSSGRWYDRTRRWGLLQWARHLAHIFTDGTVGIADYQCQQMLGDTSYRRIEPTFAPGVTIDIDALDRIDELRRFADQCLIDEDVKWLRAHWMPVPGAPPPPRSWHTIPMS